MKVGLFFGSFNPVHTGHLIIAEHVAGLEGVDQVWFVVSPHNPFKEKASLAKDYDRLHLVHLAIDDNPRLRASSVEFHLPQPSYTVDTLTHLKEKHPNHEFFLILGSDALSTFHKWKNAEFLLDNCRFCIYRRPGAEDPGPYAEHPAFRWCKAPLLDISASYIRDCIRHGRSIRYLVPDKVFNFLEETTMYKT
ncbi:MAG: nicotinate-nucleotide adenylyltransferase [Saprospiraceae bacterium]|nr:nicotinate-nucleotide adenylyltransferase [Saprospiraceae bacterium]